MSIKFVGAYKTMWTLEDRNNLPGDFWAGLDVPVVVQDPFGEMYLATTGGLVDGRACFITWESLATDPEQDDMFPLRLRADVNMICIKQQYPTGFLDHDTWKADQGSVDA